MLEGMFNLFDFEVPTSVAIPHLTHVNKNYCFEKMADNSRGGIPLNLQLI
jgi:hypothetical protein